MLAINPGVARLVSARLCLAFGKGNVRLCGKDLRNHFGCWTPALTSIVLRGSTIQEQQCRNTGFFTKSTAAEIWAGVTGVSNAGRKRGRGKGAGVKRKIDLNRGQTIGIGKKNMLWPGLTTSAIRAGEVTHQQALPDFEDRAERLQLLRQQSSERRMRTPLTPLERGWTGNKLAGRSIGPPEPLDLETFEGFDTTVLELKTVFSVTATAGRVRHISCFCVTGNGNGLVGFGLGKGNTGVASIAQSKRRASQRLMFIERADGHTVFHDFFTRFAQVRIFVERRPRGHGLQCHRAIREICHRVGIRDIYAQVEGPADSLQNIAKAFLLGLLRQRTFQQLADEKRLHLVELRPEEDNYPHVVASPEQAPVRSRAQIPPDEQLDFQLHIFEGKVPLKLPPKKPFWVNLPSYQNHINKTKSQRNHEEMRVALMSEYGEVRSFLADEHPECRAMSRARWAEQKRNAEAEDEGEQAL